MDYSALHSGEVYDPNIPEFMQEQEQLLETLYEFNHCRPSEGEKQNALLHKMLAEYGENSYIMPPLYANWGGKHLHVGSYVYVNFGLTCVDDTHIYIGDHTMLGPNVTLAAANHPLSPALREKGLQYNRPIHIGRNCWLGAGVIVVPGVTIGDNSIIGAGSIVTKDIPANVLAVGNPCRVIRNIKETDRPVL